jgi:hypothetical protein
MVAQGELSGATVHMVTNVTYPCDYAPLPHHGSEFQTLHDADHGSLGTADGFEYQRSMGLSVGHGAFDRRRCGRMPIQGS